MNEKILEKIKEARTSNHFHLKGERITDEIWNEIFKLKKLKTLSLYQAQIKKIPNKIFTLQNLVSLGLPYNIIETIPKEISKLTKLEALSLFANKIEKIPTEILKLANLRHLDLSNNKITDLPNEIIKLQSVELESNPINALKFIYKIAISKPYRYTIDNNLNLKKENIELHERKFISVKRINNCRIFIFEEKGGGSSFTFYVLGNKKNRKKTLYKIREKINKQIEKPEIRRIIIHEYFYYPLNDDFNNEFIINYNKLLKLKQAEEYLYFDEQTKKRFPVSDLIKYIDLEDITCDNKWKAEYITEFKAINFKLFKEINLKNISPNINIIIGHNGLGKTTLLQGITLSLLSVTNKDKYNIFENFIHFGKNRTELFINDEKNPQRILHVIPSGLYDLENTGGFNQLLLSYGVNLNTDKKINTQLLNEIINGNGEELYFTKSIFEDYLNNFNDPLLMLYELKIQSKNKTEIKNIINLFINKINEYLKLIEGNEKLEKLKLLEKKGFYYFKDFNDNYLKTQNLSEGYKDHILLISDMFFRIFALRNIILEKNEKNIDKEILKNLFKKTKGIILIDEFDRHLHPAWQRKLLPKIKKDFPKIQFILTTHNVASLQSAEGEYMIILSNDKNIFNCEKIPKGYSIEALYEEYFNKHSYSEPITKKLSELKERRDKMIKAKNYDNMNNTEFKKITNELINTSSQLAIIVEMELFQLNKLKNYAQTK